MANLVCPSVDMNFLSPNGFVLSIERLPQVSFFSQTVELPTLSLGSLDIGTPLSRVQIPSDQLEFSPLNIDFAVDEQMQNWQEIFRWLRGLGFPENYNQYTQENNSRGYEKSGELPRNYSDATMFILGSNNVPIKSFTFVDCFPTSLGGIRFSSTNDGVNYISSTLTLNYSYFKVDE